MLEVFEKGILNIFIQRLLNTSEEYQIKAKRCSLHFLINLMSSLKNEIVELSEKMSSPGHFLYSMVVFAFFGYFSSENQSKIKDLETVEN